MKIEPEDEPMRIMGYVVLREAVDYPDKRLATRSNGSTYYVLGEPVGTGKWSVETAVIPLAKAKARFTAMGGGKRYRIVEVVEGATIHYNRENK